MRGMRGACRSSDCAKRDSTYDEIAAQTGLSRTGVFDICKRHEAAGAKALRDAPSGRKSGDGRLLDAAQEADGAQADYRQDAGPVEDALRAVDARGGGAAHRAALWHSPAGAHDGAVPGALGLHAAKADEEGLRAVARGGEEMARRGLPGHRRPGQGRGRRDSLGRRERTAQRRRARPRLRAPRATRR